MEPIITVLPEIKIVGLPFYGDPAEGKFAQLWEMFRSIGEQITNIRQPATFYGVESYPVDFMTTGKWFYLAGVEVVSLDEIPVLTVAKVIPANRYAIFTHKGEIPNKICNTFHYAYKEWLPKSGYVPSAPYDFERYDGRFLGPTNPDSILEICIPIIKP